jgi:hypothetical protein
MTKLELIEALESLEDEDEIFVTVQTNNYWRMIAVKSINGLDSVLAEHSDYLESLVVVDEAELNNNEIDKMGNLKYVWALELGR